MCMSPARLLRRRGASQGPREVAMSSIPAARRAASNTFQRWSPRGDEPQQQRALARRGAFAATAGIVLTAACTKDIGMVGVTALEISPATVNAMAGEQVRLVATVLDEHNEPVWARGLEWSSDDPSMASVDG